MKFSEQHYNKLKPLEHYWKEFKKSGTVLKIQPNEIDILDSIHFDLYDVRLNKSCNNCVVDALIVCFTQYSKFQPVQIDENIKDPERVETRRERRARIQNPK